MDAKGSNLARVSRRRYGQTRRKTLPALGFRSMSADQVPDLIRRATQAAAQGQGQDAQRLFQAAEAAAPNHPLVLNQKAMQRLSAGDANGAIAMLEQATREAPGEAEIWFNLSLAQRGAGRLNDALTAIDKTLELNPLAIFAHIERGSLQEALGQQRAAAMSYRVALQMLPPGFNPPPAAAAALRRAADVVAANGRELESFIEERLRAARGQFGDLSSKRAEQAVDIILQKRSIFRQQPSFMYFPELPAIEFYDRAQFPQLEALEDATDDIRAELLEVLTEKEKALEPYVVIPKGVPTAQWGELANSRRWSAYYFWNEGKEFPEHIARCPRTTAALRQWPLWDIPKNGPNAMFSILEPHTRIPAHTGTANTRLVVHLPLVVPPNCGFRVGGQQREWIPGEAFVFDDSIDHEAWNGSDVPRAVLIFTIWSPHLNTPEREFVRALTTSIGEFYGDALQLKGGA